MTKIYTLEDWPDAINAFGQDVTPQRWAAFLRFCGKKSLPPTDWRTQGTVAAFVNHGHWKVMCPHCSGAQHATPNYPTFWCVECGMTWNQGKPLAVEFPKDIKQIEALLTARPDEHTRHWWPTESVESLSAENRSAGIGVK